MKKLVLQQFGLTILERMTDAFYHCTNIASFIVEEGNTKYFSQDGILFNKDKSTLIECPQAKKGAVTVADSVKTIYTSAFSNCKGLTSITIPASVKSIYNYVFSGCDKLTDIYYAGTQDQWQTLLIDEYENESDPNIGENVRIHYNYVPIELKIITQPSDVTAKTGDSVKFTVKVQGNGLQYQWYYKKAGQTAWSKWGARTTASTTASANATWNGMQVYCKITDKDGSTVNSKAVSITITDAIAITQQPTDQKVAFGKSVTLTVKASGTGLTYQWYFKKAGQSSFSVWNGRTHASETVTPNASWNGIQLYCKVKNSSVSVDSKTVKITFTDKATIVTQPTSVTAKTSETVKFTVKAEGAALSYQWYFKKKGAADWTL